MTIAICDDQARCLGHLYGVLTDYMNSINANNYAIQTYTDSKALLQEYTPNKFEFIFLDVDMPSQDGFSIAAQVRKFDLDTDIIFVTKMSEEIEQGYRYNARAYLCKPVTAQAIGNLMNRLFEERRRRRDIGRYRVKLKGSGAEIDLNLATAIYFESNLHYVVAATTDGSFTFYGRLAQIEEDLKSLGFVRVHQSYLVNMNFIFALVNNQVVFKNDTAKIPLGRKYKDTAKVAFNEYRSH